MFARIEVAIRPELSDSAAQALLRKIELAQPSIRQKIRWARFLPIYWIDIPVVREELIPAISEICWDRVLQWVFTGNLIPSASGKSGGLQDLMQQSPFRPGVFWGIERRFRPGVTDHIAKTLLESFEIVLGRPLENARTASGALFMLEGPELNEDLLSGVARDVFCNELIETWTIVPEDGLKKNDRFHQERIKYDLPKMFLRNSDQVEFIPIESMSPDLLTETSKKKLWALSTSEMVAIQKYFQNPVELERRKALGLLGPTDVELEILAQTWSEHCKHKIFNAKIKYQESGSEGSNPSHIPAEIDGLFNATIAGTTAEIPRPWLLSVFEDNAGICALDDEDAFCIKVETHNSPSALDPYGGALTGIGGVNRDILGCGLGARPIGNTDVFCVASPQFSGPLPDRLMHPRRILDGIRRGVEDGGNKSGIPTVNGALVFDPRYLGKPLVYCGTLGMMPRRIAGIACESKSIQAGDRVVMVGGRIGKDGIHGATFSSLALDATSPSSAVQLGDPLTQKRMLDFLLEARDLQLYRAITDNGAGGLSSSVGELATLCGGAAIDVSLAKTKYPGLKPFELVISESQERMTLAVPPEKLDEFLALAQQRGVEVSSIGEFTQSGRFEVFFADKIVASLDLEFLHRGVPRLELQAEWKGLSVQSEHHSFAPAGGMEDWQKSFKVDAYAVLVELLGRPNIASKEWLIRQYDHEVQGMSVIKPLHTSGAGTATAWSGPNDAGVLKPKVNSDVGIAIGCGINPKLSDVDPYLMAQAVVDEAIRNVLCVGAEFGSPECVLALVDNFCWPDPVHDASKAGALVRACFGLRDAALALGAPLVSGKDSMKNDFRGKLEGKPVQISVPPTLLMTATARVPDIKLARTADFKAAGHLIYLLGGDQLGLLGSELFSTLNDEKHQLFAQVSTGPANVKRPDWEMAKRLYSWIGWSSGKQQSRLRSLHDVSEGGLLVAITECLLARGLGAKITLPLEVNPWEFSFGEGFHSFVTSFSDEDVSALEGEWKELGIPFLRLGTVENHDRLEVFAAETDAVTGSKPVISLGMRQARSVWLKEGYWE